MKENSNDIKLNEEVEVEKTEQEIEFEKKVEDLAKEIRAKSRKEELYIQAMALKRPLNFSLEEFEEVFNGLGNEKYKDISVIIGAKCAYYYSEVSFLAKYVVIIST